MTRAALVLFGLVLAAPTAAEAPRFTSGRLETRDAGSGLEKTLRPLIEGATTATWIGWSVATDRPREMCCWDSGNDDRCCSGCRLEGERETVTLGPTSSTPVRLEPQKEMRVLLRAEAGVLTKIRSFSAGCPLDGGGAPLYWLEGVRGADSLRFLATVTDVPGVAREPRRLANQALSALAFHAAPEAIAILIDRARRGRAHVRGQALFWLAQRAGEEAVGTIARAIEEDPETDVKKKAVFALSQLPTDEGVPLLIQTARANRNPAVRKQAFFWLGQSKDPRALAFFEAVLK